MASLFQLFQPPNLSITARKGHYCTHIAETVGLTAKAVLDHGAILRKETGLDTAKIVGLVIGNPLIMKEMAKRVPDAGSHAPSRSWWMNGQTACIYV